MSKSLLIIGSETFPDSVTASQAVVRAFEGVVLGEQAGYSIHTLDLPGLCEELRAWGAKEHRIGGNIRLFALQDVAEEFDAVLHISNGTQDEAQIVYETAKNNGKQCLREAFNQPKSRDEWCNYLRGLRNKEETHHE